MKFQILIVLSFCGFSASAVEGQLQFNPQFPNFSNDFFGPNSKLKNVFSSNAFSGFQPNPVVFGQASAGNSAVSTENSRDLDDENTAADNLGSFSNNFGSSNFGNFGSRQIFPQMQSFFTQNTPNTIKFDAMPAMPSFASFPSQTWDSNKLQVTTSSDITQQLNSIFAQTGKKIASNFVQTNFADAWKKATAQFGDTRSQFPQLPFGSPGDLNNIFAQTRPESVDIAKNAFALEELSKSVRNELQLSSNGINNGLSQVSAGSVGLPIKASILVTTPSPAEEANENVSTEETVVLRPTKPPATRAPTATSSDRLVCQVVETPAMAIRDFNNPAKHPQCARNKYRTHTGECNNIVFPNRGKESTAFTRFIDADYADGIAAPRKSIIGRDLPSARLVSSSIIGVKASNAPTWTTMFTQFGQFLDHDLTSTPRVTSTDGSAIQCCDQPSVHPQCLAIVIPDNDPFYGQFGQKCMEFVRSLPGFRPGCSLGPRDQLNQISAYIDGGQIYGTAAADVQELRAFSKGMLKLAVTDDANTDYTLLPGTNDENLCSDGTDSHPCFKAGDNRCNTQVGLQAMHTVWTRHHNNMASRLALLNKQWNDEKLYQETRSVVIAQLQHIVFHEWLVVLLGEDVIQQSEMRDLSNGRSIYNFTTNIGLFNEFAGAAFRVGHSMVVSKLNRLGPDFSLLGTVRLQDTYFHSEQLYTTGAIDELVRGMARQEGKIIGADVVSDLSHKLFVQSSSQAFGLDLVSLNIQRGRDHGIPGYMKLRKLCNLPTASSFNDMKDLNLMPEDVANRLASVYASVEDIDLYVAGLSENRKGDGIIGETFSCIIAEQFRRLRVADRFWYENDLQFPSRFSDDQLTQIRKTTFAKILCDTIPGLQVSQRRVFETIIGPNQPVSCDDIAALSLRPWKDI